MAFYGFYLFPFTLFANYCWLYSKWRYLPQSLLHLELCRIEIVKSTPQYGFPLGVIPNTIHRLRKLPVLGFECSAFPVHNAGQAATLDQYVGRMEIRMREDGAVISCVHSGDGFPHFRSNAKVVQAIIEIDFCVERSKYPARDAMIHHRTTERVSEAIRCVVWDASELLDDEAEVICKLISRGV